MDFKTLTNENILLYAVKYYDNPACHGINEFSEDYDRIKYLKRLFKRYQTKRILKERLILNHIIVFYNVFGVEAATRILFFRIDQDLWSILKTFLLLLNFQPDIVCGIDGKDVLSADIPVELELASVLRRL